MFRSRRIAVMAVWGLCLTLWLCATVSAQALRRLEISSSLNPVGSGARALGMGGAFISVADDATAASWNPGGMIQLEKPEISVVTGYISRKESNTFGNHPEASNSGDTDDFNLNYLSAAYPFTVKNRNMIVSLNYQRLYDFNRDWNFRFDDPDPDFASATHYRYTQNGSLYALGLAYCAQITTQFSAGVTLNYWGDFIKKNKWNQDIYQTYRDVFGTVITSDKFDDFSFRGWNANVGFLWNIQKWTIGGVFKTPFNADISHSLNMADRISDPAMPVQPDPQIESRNTDETLHMPMAYGIGVAYRFSDSFSFAADVYRTHWNDFELEDATGNRTSPISGKKSSESDVDAATWLRLGAEYIYIGRTVVVPIRAGIFYDPAPAEGSSDDYYGFSLGTGFKYIGKNKMLLPFVFDIAYQYRLGNGVGSSMITSIPFSQDIREHTIYTSMIVHF